MCVVYVHFLTPFFLVLKNLLFIYIDLILMDALILLLENNTKHSHFLHYSVIYYRLAKSERNETRTQIKY